MVPSLPGLGSFAVFIVTRSGADVVAGYLASLPEGTKV
jgi:hypothetical protein